MTGAASRRRVLLAGIAALASATARGADGRVTLARPGSLADVLAAALAARQPLVVMVSLEGCPFCREVRDAYLGPLRDEAGQHVVQVDMLSPRPIRAFDGRATTHDALVRAWRVPIAPTVLFIGSGGREVAQRLVGSGLPDFYGAYLDERVRLATQAVRS